MKTFELECTHTHIFMTHETRSQLIQLYVLPNPRPPHELSSLPLHFRPLPQRKHTLPSYYIPENYCTNNVKLLQQTKMIYPHILKNQDKENHLFRKIIKNRQKSDFSSIELRFFISHKFVEKKPHCARLAIIVSKKCCDYSSVHKPRYNSIGHWNVQLLIKIFNSMNLRLIELWKKGPKFSQPKGS